MPTATADAPSTEAKTGNKPVETFRIRNISVSIFEQPAKKGDREYTFHTVSPQRSFKVGDERKYAGTFSRDDLPVVIELLKRAWDFINDAEQDRRESGAGEAE